MLTDDTVLEGEDLHILERMKTFLLEKDVASNSIAPQLLSIVIRMVNYNYIHMLSLTVRSQFHFSLDRKSVV